MTCARALTAVISATALTVAACAAAIAQPAVRIGLSSLPTGSGNPFTSPARTAWYTYRAIFDTLTQLGPDGRPAPALALSWSNRDPQTWIVKLRPDTAFSNGEPVDAAAVIATVSYLQSPAAAQDATAREAQNIAGMRALDPTTIEFTTKQPDPMFPRQMAVLPIVPPLYWTKAGRDGFARQPVGSGPFTVTGWNPTRLTLASNPRSWRAPRAARLELVALPETSTRVQALLAGRVDVASEIGPEDIEAVEAAGFKIYQRPASSMEVVAFNTLIDSPLKDVRVRQALNYAVDRQAIADTIMHGLVPPGTQTAARANPEYDPSLKAYPYDPAKAKALLAAAGYANGFSFIFEMSNGTTGSHYASMIQKVADDLAQIGVRMEVRPIPWAQYARGVQLGEWKGQAFGFEYETLPTGEVLRPFRLHSCAWSHPWYCDESLTPVIDEAKRTFDPTRRLDLVHRILREYRDKAAALILMEPLGLDGISPKLRNYQQTNGIIPFQDLTVEP